MLQRLVSILIVFSSISAFGQKPFPYGRMDTIVVSENGTSLKMPWTGGLNNAQFQSIDLNWDGKKDIVVYDNASNGYGIKTFINTGQTGEMKYTYAPEYAWQFPAGLNVRGFLILRDYNCDGLEDLFTYREGGIALYKNVGNSTIGFQWQLVTDYIPATVFGGPSGVYCTITDIPSIEDLDGDGDLDFVTSAVGGILFYRYKNISDNCDSLKLVRDDGCWGNFYESSFSNDLIFNATCKGGSGRKSRHAASTILAIDLNGDDLTEVILGDSESDGLTVAYNTGTIDNAQMTSADYDFPANDTPVDINEYNAAFHIDVNNDNVKDLVVAPHFEYSEDTANSWLYLNSGSSYDVDLTLETKGFLGEDMLDFGSLSYPSYIDVDQDGLLDILIGHMGYYASYSWTTYQPGFKSQLAYLRNVGNNNFPEYELIDRDFNGLSAEDRFGLFPTFGDLDGDSDDDMICGTINGPLCYFENIAPLGSTAQFVLSDTNYMSIDHGSFSAPELYDLNNDGLLDLVIGIRSGILKYHENTGNSTTPQFSATPTNDSLGGLEYYNPRKNGFIRASFGVSDTTNKPFAFVGTQDGVVYIFNDIENNLLTGDHFNQIDSLRTGVQLINVDVANINFSDSLEWIAGEAPGGISLWGRSSRYVAPPEDTLGVDDLTNTINFTVFPNPATNQISIRSNEEINDEVTVSLVDLSGRVLVNKQLSKLESNQIITLNTQSISSGIYLLTLYRNSVINTKKVIIRKN